MHWKLLTSRSRPKTDSNHLTQKMRLRYTIRKGQPSYKRITITAAGPGPFTPNKSIPLPHAHDNNNQKNTAATFRSY